MKCLISIIAMIYPLGIFFLGVQAFASVEVSSVSGVSQTIYKARSETCRVEFSNSKKTPDHSEIRNSCPLSNKDSIKALDAALSAAQNENGSLKINSLLIGGPDGGNASYIGSEAGLPQEPTFHLRLAKLLMESKEWDAKKGKSLKGSKGELILKLLQKSNPMPELFEVFKKHSLNLSYKSVEEILTLTERISGKFYSAIGAKPTDVFPDSMSIYLKAENR